MLLAEKINNLEKHEAKINNQLCQIASLTFQVEDLKSERELLLNVNTELKFKLNEQEKCLADLNSTLKNREDLIGKYEKENIESMSEIQAVKEKHHNIISNKNQEHQEKVEKLEEKIKLLEKEIQRMNNDNSFLLNFNLTDENRRLKNTLVQKEDILFKTTADFEQFKLVSAETKENLKNKVQNLKSELLQVSDRFKEKETSEIESRNYSTHQETELKTLEKQLNEIDQELRRKKTELNGYTYECEQNKKQMLNKCKSFLEDFHRLIQSARLRNIPDIKFQHKEGFLLEEIFQDVLLGIKLIISANTKCRQDQAAMLKDLNKEIKFLKSEIEDNRIEMQSVKLEKEKLENINKETEEKISSLEMLLQNAEVKLKQDLKEREKQIDQFMQQVKSLKREMANKDVIISDMVFHFNKEIKHSTHKFKELWDQHESQNVRILNLMKRKIEFEQQSDELKNLLKESHEREEQTRELLREKHDSLILNSPNFEDTKYLLKASRETNNIKQQYKTTKLLLQRNKFKF